MDHRGHGGRDPAGEATLAAVRRFNDAFNRHDVDAVMAAMTDDCVFESTRPPPDGERIEGQARMREYWRQFFRLFRVRDGKVAEKLSYVKG